tara:strand:+ start:228 stop:518 length:291 start_codon:yes stop_codon:yes gene_type:complete
MTEFETDITGYGRKMGRDSGGNGNGRIDYPVFLGPNDGTGEWVPAGSVSYRTMNPASGESSGGLGGIAGNYWGVNRINNVSGSGSPQIDDPNYPKT